MTDVFCLYVLPRRKHSSGGVPAVKLTCWRWMTMLLSRALHLCQSVWASSGLATACPVTRSHSRQRNCPSSPIRSLSRWVSCGLVRPKQKIGLHPSKRRLGRPEWNFFWILFLVPQSLWYWWTRAPTHVHCTYIMARINVKVDWLTVLVQHVVYSCFRTSWEIKQTVRVLPAPLF